MERWRQFRNDGSEKAGIDDGRVQVVVYTDQNRSVGIVVDRILDIAHESVKSQKHSGRKGSLGSVVVQNRVTELRDVKGITQEADPSFFAEPVVAV